MRLGKPGKWMAALLTAAICLSVVGCGNAEVNNDISSEPEPEVVHITQITEDDPEENKVEEITFSDIKEIDEYINENLALDADEEIESCEWVDSDRSCFRVRICYKEAPVNEYKHKRDLFVFVGSKLTSVMVDYPSHDDYSAPRHVCEGNDFVLTGSDNLFGYSLIKDSVKFTGNALALADAFKNANWAKLTEEDFTYKYGDNTFGITSEWSDYVDALGYPEDFEENNYGYVTTDAAGYRWEMRYPSQSDAEYDFKVVMVSPSPEIDDVDTYIESISLMQTETVRGIKVGDSVDDLATAYGHPEYISLHDGNDKWTDLTYWYKGEYSLVFVIADNKIIAIHMY